MSQDDLKRLPCCVTIPVENSSHQYKTIPTLVKPPALSSKATHSLPTMGGPLPLRRETVGGEPYAAMLSHKTSGLAGLRHNA